MRERCPQIFYGKDTLKVTHNTEKVQKNELLETEKSSKTGQGKKSLISTFACFLTAISRV